MSIVNVQSVTPVHLSIIKCHQIKKRHHIWLLLMKVFTELKKVLSLKWRNPPWEASNWWRRGAVADPAIRPIVECSVGVSPGQKGKVLRVTRGPAPSSSQFLQPHHQPLLSPAPTLASSHPDLLVPIFTLMGGSFHFSHLSWLLFLLPKLAHVSPFPPKPLLLMPPGCMLPLPLAWIPHQVKIRNMALTTWCCKDLLGMGLPLLNCAILDGIGLRQGLKSCLRNC